MKRSLAHLPTAVLAAAAIALVAGAAPAQALDSCSAGTPCLPQNAAFQSTLPNSVNAGFFGNVPGSTLFATNSNSELAGLDKSGVLGVYSGSVSGSGVVGRSGLSTAADVTGVFGHLEALTPGMGAAGVRGESEATGSAGIGVVGLQGGSGAGVVGFTPSGLGVVGASGSTGIAVAGSNPTGFAGYFLGNVHVQGTLTKSAGAFRIDHPLDPAHKYLQHAFVESPEMLNVYNGNVRTDAKGLATVRLPRYFQALNRDFRYQLTTLGESGWDARAGVWREIRGNSFVIRTDRPLVKVSWQVTGVREDAYARAHRIQVELPKPATDLERRLRTQIRQVATG